MLLNANVFQSATLIVILQIPMMNPVFKRELQNRMYGPTVYYLARLMSSLLM